VRKRFVLRESTSLRVVTYDDANATMDVEFRHGGRYRYFLVPRSVVSGLLAAPSAGQYFNTQVRPRYQEQKLT
jgi:hypothetical protein